MSQSSNHPICGECWKKRHPDKGVPFRYVDDFTKPEKCCFCSARTETKNGVFISERNDRLICQTDHSVKSVRPASTPNNAPPSDGDIK